MKSVIFTSDNEHRLELLVQLAKEMGIDTHQHYTIPEDDYGLPGSVVNEAEMDAWLSKEEGEERYTSKQVLDIVNKDLDALKENGG